MGFLVQRRAHNQFEKKIEKETDTYWEQKSETNKLIKNLKYELSAQHRVSEDEKNKLKKLKYEKEEEESKRKSLFEENESLRIKLQSEPTLRMVEHLANEKCVTKTGVELKK